MEQNALFAETKPTLAEISPEVKAWAIKKLSIDQTGNTRKGEDGKDIDISVQSAKEHGKYQGRVLLNNEQYLVQAIGKDELSAVVHDKTRMEFVGSRMQWLDQNKRMQGQSVQIFYNGDKSKTYPWNSERAKEATKETAKEAAPDVKKQLETYASTLKGKQREAFEKHLAAAFAPPQQVKAEPVKTASTKAAKPKAGKEVEAEMER
jgi:hypothetical protein